MEDISDSFTAAFDVPKKLRPEVFTKLQNALNILHREGYVHGDFRAPNILINKNGDVRIIDFDWCGKEGEARYPLFINPEINNWEAKPGNLMKKSDDLAF